MDFAALPPEINSGRIYAGAGAGPMMTAASAWDGLASELNAAAAWPPQPHPMRLDERQRHAGTTDHRPGPLGPRSCVCRNGATSVHCCQSKPVGVIVASNIIGQNTAA